MNMKNVMSVILKNKIATAAVCVALAGAAGTGVALTVTGNKEAKEATGTDATASDAGKKVVQEEAPEDVTVEETTVEETTAEETTAVEETMEEETTEEETTEEETTADPFEAVSKVAYAAQTVNVRSAADSDSERLGQLGLNNAVEVTGYDGTWYRILYNGETAYVWADYLSDTETATEAQTRVEQQIQTEQEPQTEAQTQAAQTVQEVQTQAVSYEDSHGHLPMSMIDFSGLPYTDPKFLVDCGGTLPLYEWGTYFGMEGFFATSSDVQEVDSKLAEIVEEDGNLKYDSHGDRIYFLGDAIGARHGAYIHNDNETATWGMIYWTAYHVAGVEGPSGDIYFYGYPESSYNKGTDYLDQYSDRQLNGKGYLYITPTGTFSPDL